MKLHEQIQKALNDFPLPYTLEKKRDHVFMLIEGVPKFCVGGMGKTASLRTVSATVSKLRKIRQAAMSSIDANKHDA